MMSFDRFNRYGGYSSAESATVRKQKASASIQKMKKKNPDIEPIIIEGRALAKSWWGKAWNKNLESYSDYRNRIGRGKSYVRSGSVIDLKLQPGQVTALVQGSRAKPYEVKIGIDPLSKKNWEEVTARCNHRVDSLQQLVEGSFPEALAGLFTDHKYGLFPSPGEIHFQCSCPDWASMCKHVAATLYGVGARLDSNPQLFFELRGLEGKALVRKSMEQKLESMLKNAGKKSHRQLPEKDISRIFGL